MAITVTSTDPLRLTIGKLLHSINVTEPLQVMALQNLGQEARVPLSSEPTVQCSFSALGGKAYRTYNGQ